MLPVRCWRQQGGAPLQVRPQATVAQAAGDGILCHRVLGTCQWKHVLMLYDVYR